MAELPNWVIAIIVAVIVSVGIIIAFNFFAQKSPGIGANIYSPFLEGIFGRFG
jgi:hypothetical protein